MEHSRLQNENEFQKEELNSLKKTIEEMTSKVKEIEEKAKKIESTAMNYKNSLSDKSIQILEKEGLINKLNEEIAMLKSGSKVEELVCFFTNSRLVQHKKLKS